jgi:hypothetical protein
MAAAAAAAAAAAIAHPNPMPTRICTCYVCTCSTQYNTTHSFSLPNRAPHSVLARFFNAVVPVVASRTGAQLMLVDADYAVPWLHAQQRAHDTAAAAYSDAHACVDAAAAAPGPGPDSTGLHKRRAWGTALPEQQKDQQQEQQAAPTQHSRKRRQLPLPGVSRGAAAPLLMLMAHPAGYVFLPLHPLHK